LQAAAENGRIDMIQFLLGHGAKTTGRYRIQYIMAIAAALRSGHEAAADILRRHREWTEEEKDLLKAIKDDLRPWMSPCWDDYLSELSCTCDDGSVASDSCDWNTSSAGRVKQGGDDIEQNVENTDHIGQNMVGDKVWELEISKLDESPRNIKITNANGGDNSQEGEVNNRVLVEEHLTGISDGNVAERSGQVSRSAQVDSLRNNQTAQPIWGSAWMDDFFNFDLYSQ
jgi:hypothetical protein